MTAVVLLVDAGDEVCERHCGMQRTAREPVGSPYRLDRTCPCVRLCRASRANGLGWSRDALAMYYTDAPTLTVDAFDFDIATSGLENRRILITCGRRCRWPGRHGDGCRRLPVDRHPGGHARFDGSHRRAIALEVIDVPTRAPGSRPVVPVRTVDRKSDRYL
jgi:hypothetical protein